MKFLEGNAGGIMSWCVDCAKTGDPIRVVLKSVGERHYEIEIQLATNRWTLEDKHLSRCLASLQDREASVEDWKHVMVELGGEYVVPDNMKKTTWREFTKSDWCGFAGAERVGGEPYIAEIWMKAWNEPVILIADDTGLGLFVADQEIAYFLGCTFQAAVVLGESITCDTTKEGLELLGLKRIN